MAQYETAGSVAPPAVRPEGYWRENNRLQFGLLAVWAVFGYVLSIFLAGPLNEVTVYGFPVAFWFAQQGAIIVFVILIFVYAWQMGRLDEKYDVHEGEALLADGDPVPHAAAADRRVAAHGARGDARRRGPAGG